MLQNFRGVSLLRVSLLGRFPGKPACFLVNQRACPVTKSAEKGSGAPQIPLKQDQIRCANKLLASRVSRHVTLLESH